MAVTTLIYGIFSVNGPPALLIYKTGKKSCSYSSICDFLLCVNTKCLLYILLMQDTISILHNATTAGVVPVVSELLTSERLALSRDQYGATPLHKAVLFYQPKLVKLIADKYRITTRAKDQVRLDNFCLLVLHLLIFIFFRNMQMHT